MTSILQTCRPRKDILTGTFNPEIFTASLGQVLEAYRGKSSVSHTLYTQAEPFFREATYATEGLRRVLRDVFGRLAGDNGYPAIHRLETGFGGGKTHTLIALTHLAYRGRDLLEITADLLAAHLQPEPGSITIVGIAGDKVAVHKPQGTQLIPYTLWGEIAYRIGGEALYRQMEHIATSRAAPDEGYLETVFQGRRVLIMLDELAQYAARLTAVHPNNSEQLAAFLMTLLGYASTHSGIAVVVTLASRADAFAARTEELARLLTEVRGEKVNTVDAVNVAERARRESLSVVDRQATSVVPVQSSELSRVLARRLFEQIDPQAAHATADAYRQLYDRSAATLPQGVNQTDYRDRLVEHFPFHPTFIGFLTRKLSQVESFQGTRGVLRVLALVVRRLWEQRQPLPMIHTCHLDLRDERIVTEIMSRTDNTDLIPPLEADVGSVGSGSLDTGLSVAAALDRANPHPAGLPYHEWTWKTVFLHSLVGRVEGLGARQFGIFTSDALLEVSQPELTPPQVEKALEAIRGKAYYLRERDGRYYADTAPTLNRILETIRADIQRRAELVQEELKRLAREMVRQNTGAFAVVADVSEPADIPDNKNRPVLAVIDPTAARIDAEAMVTTVGENCPRLQQNLVFLLVPDTVRVVQESHWDEDRVRRMRESLDRLSYLAGRVLAIQRLKARPENYGVRPKVLEEDEQFREDSRKLPNDLSTGVVNLYGNVWYPGSGGQVIHRGIRTSGAEGGAAIIDRVRRALLEAGGLVTEDNALTREMLIVLGQLFFRLGPTPALAKIREAFACNRPWPVLDSPEVLEKVVRAGVEKDYWCLFRMDDPQSTRPEQLFSRDKPIDWGLNLNLGNWYLITPQGARQRGWGDVEKVEPGQLEQWVLEITRQQPEADVQQIHERLREKHGAVTENEVIGAVERLVQTGRLLTYHTPADTAETPPPDLIHREEAVLHKVKPGDYIITPAEASRRNWLAGAERSVLDLMGPGFTQKLMATLRRLGALYANRGARTHIDSLDIADLKLPGGGRLRLVLEDVSPEDMRRLSQLFEDLADCTRADDKTLADLRVNDPDESCPFLQAVKPD